jgi:hypothetical protein
VSTLARVREIDADMAAKRAEYERVRARMQQPQYVQDIASALGAVCALLKGFKPGDSGEHAIYLVGRVQGAMAPLEADLVVVHEYESLRDRRRRLEPPPAT